MAEPMQQEKQSLNVLVLCLKTFNNWHVIGAQLGLQEMFEYIWHGLLDIFITEIDSC